MVFDTSKVQGRIVEKFGTRTAFAKATGFTDPTLSSRLNGKTNWTMDEIYMMIQPDVLDIAPHEIVPFFYTPKFD